MSRVCLLVVSFCCVLFTACNTTPVKPDPLLNLSSADLKQIQSVDELATMREKLANDLVGKTEVDYGSDFAALAQIDSQIIELKKAELSTQFAAKRLSAGVIALPALDKMSAELDAAPLLPQEKWQALKVLVQTEREKTQAYSESLEEKVSGLEQASEILPVYDDLVTITGASTWALKRDKVIENLVAEIREASASEDLDEKTRDKIDLIKQLVADDDVLTDELTTVDAKIYEKTFFDQLGAGKADDAYSTLVQMSEAKDFAVLKEKLSPISEDMAALFLAKADESVNESSNLSQSYRWYNQGQKIYAILGLDAIPNSKFSALSDQLHTKAKQLSENDEHAAALAYLYAIKGFQPNRLGLRKELVEFESKVTDLAVKRLSTTDFQSSYKDQDYGDVISSFVTQYLFEHVPHDVRIVEREQYEAILRERQLSGNDSALSSVNLLVSGSVLESKVDSTEAKNKKMMRVEVGKETIPNPNYISWLELATKDRKTIDKPSETIDVVKHENISVGVTHHRKVGIFSVSYRLVEASTGRVIFPDSITLSNEHADESSEGVEMGDFVVPFKVADLPSDVEILDELAKKVSTEIGKKLVAQLKDQELKYLSQAESFETQNDCAGYVASIGNAMMIMRLKALDTNSIAQSFETEAVACFN